MDGGFIIVGTSWDPYLPDCWVVKTSSNGTMQWNQRVAEQSSIGSDATAFCIRQTSDGGYIVAGYAFSTIPHTNTAALDFWVAKVAATYSLFLPAVFGTSSIIVCLASIVFFALRDQRVKKEEALSS